MWRAFFFAIGISLILLGGQCLIVDHFVVANSTRIPSVVAKFLDSKNPDPRQNIGIGQPVVNAQSRQPNPFQQANYPISAQNNRQLPSGSGSRFGPSRFDNSQFSNSQLPANSYYGGRPFGLAGTSGNGANPIASNPQFSMAGYGQTPRPVNGPLVGGLVGPGGTNNSTGRALRLVKPKDWMPWALLAVGTLVVLYTNSTGRRYNAD